MKVTFDNDAKKLIEQKTTENEVILIDLDDGVGMFSKVGMCSLDTSFRVLLVDKNIDFEKDYNVELESNIGPIFIKKSSDYYFKDDINFKVKKNTNTLQMSDTSEMLDGAVAIEHIKKDEVH
ncbi:iron-sulfur cluster biosynthesis family protein [Companilactobacillus sp. DQM5]|uniref:iron-sulfur cluster biosynthesis family protein n=1 Tax=Companilactobacillus sp. DQM5 TaxID=3463359 RepID=UPI0040593C2F